MILKETLIFFFFIYFRLQGDKVYLPSSTYEALFVQYQSSLCSFQDQLSFQQALIQNSNQEYGDNNSYFGFSIDLIKNVSQGLGYSSSLFPKQAIAGAFFLALIFLLIFIQLILSILNLCCCRWRAHIKEDHASVCNKLMIYFYLAYVAFFVVVIVYAGISGQKVKRSFCYFSQIPYLTMTGINIQGFQFVGLSWIKQTVDSFGQQVTAFSPYLSNLTAIRNLNLSQSGINTQNAAESIGNYYQGRLIVSPYAANSFDYPELFNAMDSIFISPILAEFMNIKNLSQQISNLANSANTIITAQQGSLNPQQTSQAYVSQLDSTIVKSSYYFNRFLNFIDYMMKYKVQFIAVLISFISFCLILYLIFVCVVYNQNVKGKCYDCQMLIKLFIILMVVLTIIVFLITLFFYAFTIINSTVCNVSTQFLNIGDFSLFFDADEQEFAQMLNACIGNKATGNIFTGIYNNFQFGGIISILQGIYNAQLYKQFITSSNGTPLSTSEPLNYTTQTLNGTFMQLPDITTQLAALNTMVSCANITFGFITNSTVSTKSVSDTTVLQSNASCYSFAAANQLRQLLAASLTSVQTTFQGFQTVLNNANSTYGTNITNLQTAYTQLNPILNNFGSVYTNNSSYSESFEQITDCRALKSVIITAQQSVCGSLNGNLYLLMIFLFFITYLMFFLNCCFCCMLRRKPVEQEENKEQEEKH